MEPDVSAAPATAAALGLLACDTCALLSRAGPRSHGARCPRCGSPLHARKPGSVGRTWAFLIASVALYIPANVLPIMQTSSLFGAQRDTIMSGVVFLWKSGSWSLALIVFIASVLVPLAKMLALGLLLVSVRQRWTWQPQQRIRLYRVIEAIGRWSILDIYVVALLATLVQLRALGSIAAGPGAIAFGAVVVLTMFAATAFDPRLIWDPARRHA